MTFNPNVHTRHHCQSPLHLTAHAILRWYWFFRPTFFRAFLSHFREWNSPPLLLMCMCSGQLLWFFNCLRGHFLIMNSIHLWFIQYFIYKYFYLSLSLSTYINTLYCFPFKTILHCIRYLSLSYFCFCAISSTNKPKKNFTITDSMFHKFWI